jgi:nondiscriminating aspartyl-tRNA synthetase
VQARFWVSPTPLRAKDYLAALQARGLDPEPLAGYLEAFKYGMPPEGGFAIGLER